MLYPVQSGGFAYAQEVSSTQMTQIDLNASSGLDRRSGQSDTLASAITVTGGLTFSSGSALTMGTGSQLNTSGGANINISNNGTITIGVNGSLALVNGSNFNSTASSNINLNIGATSSVNFSTGGTLNVNSGAYLYLNSGSNTQLASGATISLSSGSVTQVNGTINVNQGSNLQLANNTFISSTGTSGIQIFVLGISTSNQLLVGNAAITTNVLGSSLIMGGTSSNYINLLGVGGVNQINLGSNAQINYLPTRAMSYNRLAINLVRVMDSGWTLNRASFGGYSIATNTASAYAVLEVPKIENATLTSMVINNSFLGTSAAATVSLYSVISNTKTLISSLNISGQGRETMSGLNIGFYNSMSSSQINGGVPEYYIEIQNTSTTATIFIRDIEFLCTVSGTPRF